MQWKKEIVRLLETREDENTMQWSDEKHVARRQAGAEQWKPIELALKNKVKAAEAHRIATERCQFTAAHLALCEDEFLVEQDAAYALIGCSPTAPKKTNWKTTRTISIPRKNN